MLKTDIYKFSYNPKDIRKMIKSKDFWKFDITKDNVDLKTQEISEEFANNEQQIKNINKNKIKKSIIYTTESLYDTLTIRKTNDILKKIFNLSLSSRELEIKQLYKIIQSEKNNDVYIYRTDIKKFFESLPFKVIIDELKNNNLISATTYKHLINIYNHTSKTGFEGLPRGLSISSSLSEYAMRIFDKKIWNIENCIYYSRYVDDIVIITNKTYDLSVPVNKLLPYGIELNPNKTFFEKIGTDKKIDFLGYALNLKDISKSNIAKSKIDRLKTRIVLSLNSFLKKDNNFKLLVDRLKFLSCNSNLKIAGRKKILTVGLRYQYSIFSHESILKQLKTLDTYFKKILYSKKYHLSKKLKSKLNNKQLTELEKISFYQGYLRKITYSYNRKHISKIKDGWRYE